MVSNSKVTDLADDNARRTSEQLERHYHRIQDRQVCYEVWRDYLTAEQRETAGGDVLAFLGRGGTVALWMAVFKVSWQRAIVDVAQLLGLPQGEANYLLRSIGETASAPSAREQPRWDRASLQLSFRGHVVRTVMRPKAAKCVIAILDAFEEEGWPARIDDPLPVDVGATRLPNAIKSLNKSLLAVRFHADGADGVRWNPVT